MYKYDQTTGVFLTANASQRARYVLGNGLVLYGIGVQDVLTDLSLDTPVSTASRAFSTEYDEMIRRADVIKYLRWLSVQSQIDHDALVEWVVEGVCNDPRIRLLAADGIFPHTGAGLAVFESRINGLIKKRSQCVTLLEKPSASFLPPEARQLICKLETAQMAAPFTAFRTESNFARKRFNGVHDRNEDREAVPVYILSWIGLDSVMKRFACDDHRNSLVEALLGGVDNKYILIGLLDDRPGRRGALLLPALHEFDIRSVVDNTYSIRRHRQSLHRYLFDASSSNAQGDMVAEDIKVTEEARRLATFNPQRIEDWLLDYGSEDCWRKLRKRHDENWER